ncbi:MAG: hypothetical protein ACI910_002207 [Oleispira sp.]|jgi:hypothetical protein
MVELMKIEREKGQIFVGPLWKKLKLTPHKIESLYLESLMNTEEILRSNLK